MFLEDHVHAARSAAPARLGNGEGETGQQAVAAERAGERSRDCLGQVDGAPAGAGAATAGAA